MNTACLSGKALNWAIVIARIVATTKQDLARAREVMADFMESSLICFETDFKESADVLEKENIWLFEHGCFYFSKINVDI